MLSIPAGSFVMGAREDESGPPDELPRRTITLSAYKIGKYEVTNAEYAAVLNWALDHRYIKATTGDVYYKKTRLKVVDDLTDVRLQDGKYRAIERNGLPMNNHPVSDVTWYGAAMYTNWLSRMHGLEPCYNTDTWELFQPLPNGYRLPMEAEWERAAGSKIPASNTPSVYGFASDKIDSNRLNYNFNNPLGPLGSVSSPRTTPVGYFNGRNPDTVDSPSAVGCYDMSGNVYEWCHDWFDNYAPGPQSDPAGLPTGMNVLNRGPNRIMRGGGWGSNADSCRVANRGFGPPHFSFRFFGFRLARSLQP